MDLMDKLTVLTDSAKYDAACSSSGADRPGATVASGCCHSFSADGRCISLLKILMTNICIYNCKYCVNRAGNQVQRCALTPEELADLTIQFYRRNYIEGLFLSSGVIKNPDYTMERMIQALSLLRNKYNFRGYIHAKTIPGASPELVEKIGLLADRISVNIELPSQDSLSLLAPDKTKKSILDPMSQIKTLRNIAGNDIIQYKNAPRFATAGQATQMIIGATPESDYQIIKLASALYKKYELKRVFYSAYIPVVSDTLLPALDTTPPLLREHRLYQADWLIRMYKFDAEEILNENTPNFNPYLDPKCNWAINNIHLFPIDINIASKENLLRVPGIGPKSAGRIITARKYGKLDSGDLARMGVVLKRAKYFIITKDNPAGMKMHKELVVRSLLDPNIQSFGIKQLSLFDDSNQRLLLPSTKDVASVNQALEEAVLCLMPKI